MKKINLNVPINSLGYGVVGYNVWKHLSQSMDVSLFPIGYTISPPTDDGNKSIPVDISKRIHNDSIKANNFDGSLTTLKIWHENQLAERVGFGKYYAWPFFEISKFDQRRISHMQSVDQIIVSSEWAKNIVEKNVTTAEPLVVECGVDRTIFHEEVKPRDISPEFIIQEISKYTPYVFLNCGKWEVRKGHDVLYKAFKNAFAIEKYPDVELWMMSSNPFLTDSERRHWESLYRSDPRIKILDRVDFQTELAAVMAGADCGVFPSRAEGWNLEVLEMMSMGKQVITTNYSAHTQFCNNMNSYLIDIEEEEPVYDGKFFTGDNGLWASLKGNPFDQLVSHMRHAYNTGRRRNNEGIETAKSLSWEKVSKKLIETMSQSGAFDE